MRPRIDINSENYKAAKAAFYKLKTGDLVEMKEQAENYYGEISVIKSVLLLVLDDPVDHKALRTWHMGENKNFYINDIDFTRGYAWLHIPVDSPVEGEDV